MLKDYKEIFQSKNFFDAVKGNNICLFLGAGIGKNIGMPNWLDLSKEIINFCMQEKIIKTSEQINLLNINNPLKSISICVEKIEEKSKQKTFNMLLCELFYKNPKKEYKNNTIYQNLNYLYKNNLALIVQTNYDVMIEKYQTYKEGINKNFYIPYKDEFSEDKIRNSIIYLHGRFSGDTNDVSLSSYDDLILTKKNYNEIYVLKKEIAYKNQKKFIEHLLKQYYIIFLGYSLNDMEILELIANRQKTEKYKEISIIVDNCDAKNIENEFNSKYLFLASNKKVNTYTYNTETIGIKNAFTKVIDDLKTNIKRIQEKSDILEYVNPKDVDIKNLCEKLRDDLSDKSLFFNEISSPKFLMPLFEENLLNLTDEASSFVVQYLEKIYNNSTVTNIKTVMIDMVNKCDITNVDRWTYYQLIKLLEKFDIEIYNEIDCSKLLRHENYMDFIISLYKNNQIYDNNNLTKLTLLKLLEYKIIKDFSRNIAKTKFCGYQFYTLVAEKSTSENFKNAISQDFIFVILEKLYSKIYNKIMPKKNEIIDAYITPTIDIEKFLSHLKNTGEVKDILSVIMYLIHTNVTNSTYQVNKHLKLLLSNDIFMLRKLALSIIASDINQYKQYLTDFFINTNEQNIVKVIDICLYEIVTILKIISKNSNDFQEFDDDISKFLKKIPNEKLKYNVLHGLKEHEKFKDLFYELKNKYQYEQDTPGIYIKLSLGGWVKDIAPITKDDFSKMNISEQIKYVNSDVLYHEQPKQISDDTIEEENERGLINLFKEIVSEDINKYLNDKHIFNLSKLNFVQTFINILSNNIENININNAIKFVNQFSNNAIDNQGNSKDLLLEIINFNRELIIKKHKYFNKVSRNIKFISTQPFEEINFKSENDIEFVILNTIHGQNFYCYFRHLFIAKNVTDYDYRFINDIIEENNNKKLCILYYYIGRQYSYLSKKFKKNYIKNLVINLKDEQLSYFINGYIMTFNEYKSFKTLKTNIIYSLENNLIKNDRIKERLVNMLLYEKLVHNRNNLFSEFEKYFSGDDYIYTLRHLIYSNNRKYKKNNIKTYWVDIIKKEKISYSDYLLEIFNKYFTLKDIKTYEKFITILFNTGINENLIVNQNIETFLKKLLEYLNTQNDKSTVFDILCEIISSFKSVKYFYKELDILENILERFKRIDPSSTNVLVNRIYEIKSLKIYFSRFKKYYS